MRNQKQQISPLTASDWEACLNGLALLAQCFWPPEPELIEDLLSGRAQADLDRLAGLIGPSGGPEEPTGEEVDSIRGYVAATGEDLAVELEAAYIRLFGAARGGLIAPPYQSCYEEAGLLMGRPAEMMAARLAEAGIDLSGRTAEPPDHLAVELEYLFLILEAAVVGGRPDDLAEAARFARTEMSPWLAEFTARLDGQAGAGFYQAAARLALATVRFIVSVSGEERAED